MGPISESIVEDMGNCLDDRNVVCRFMFSCIVAVLVSRIDRSTISRVNPGPLCSGVLAPSGCLHHGSFHETGHQGSGSVQKPKNRLHVRISKFGVFCTCP